MKNDLIIFENAEFGRMRTFLKNGEPWFVAVDVCRALDIRNNRDALSRLDDDEKGVDLIDTPGGKQKATVVNESGLYTLVMGSRKPETKAFKRWVTHEVIPSIRKYGAYATDAVLDELGARPEIVPDFIRLLKEENAKARAARKELAKVQRENALLRPKADYYDTFVSPENLTCISYTAKELGVELTKFVGYLLDHGYVFRDRYRDGRIFAKAGKKNSRLFETRDFYLPSGRKSEYTLVTPEGKAYFKSILEEIREWEPYDPEAGEADVLLAVFAG
ncbi:MAG: phage antirepressor [Clostridia bacterium]|nr:phage antirepressor [Clostridia bacterium]